MQNCENIPVLSTDIQSSLKKTNLLILALAYYFLLGYFFTNYLVPLFSYEKLLTSNYSLEATIVGMLSIVGLTMLLPSRESLVGAV